MGEKLTAATLALIGYEVAVLRYGHDAVDTFLFLSDDDAPGDFDEPKPVSGFNARGEWRIEVTKMQVESLIRGWLVTAGCFPLRTRPKRNSCLPRNDVNGTEQR